MRLSRRNCKSQHSICINDIAQEQRGLTVDTALRLLRQFGGDVQSRMNLQTAYEIKVAAKEKAKRIVREVMPMRLE